LSQIAGSPYSLLQTDKIDHVIKFIAISIIT
jgi:hypothetical protein